MTKPERRVSNLSVPLGETEHRKLLEITASRMLAEGRRVTTAETVRRLIREAPVATVPPRGPRLAA